MSEPRTATEHVTDHSALEIAVDAMKTRSSDVMQLALVKAVMELTAEVRALREAVEREG